MKKKRCPRKSDPESFCPACWRAEGICAKLDAVFTPQDSDRGSRWAWALIRWRRMMSQILMERRAALIRLRAPKWVVLGPEGLGWRSGPRCAGGGSGIDLDGVGSWGKHVRQWEDRDDQNWEHQ